VASVFDHTFHKMEIIVEIDGVSWRHSGKEPDSKPTVKSTISVSES